MEPPLVSLSPPNETFSVGNGLHIIEFLAEGDPRKPPKQSRLLPKLVFALSELMVKTLLLKAASVQLIEDRGSELLPT